MRWIIVSLFVSMMVACTSTYYANEEARKLPSEELARIDLGFWQDTWTLTFDGEPIEIPLFGQPDREILIPAGEHTVTLNIKRKKDPGLGLLHVAINAVFDSGPKSPEIRDLTPAELKKVPTPAKDQVVILSYSGLFVGGRRYPIDKAIEWEGIEVKGRLLTLPGGV